MDLVVEPLASHHNRTAFSCGVPSLDAYLHQQAGQDRRRDLAVCYVLHDRGSAEITGYYALSATSIEPTALPPALAKRLGRYPVLPATLLGRLAVDARFTGRGMGGLLLLNAMRRTLHTGIGSLAIVVDAIDERAATFYERFEFQRIEDSRLRLYLLMSKVRDVFPGEGGP
jgi:GNAT superfamily N-acetyltransferase